MESILTAALIFSVLYAVIEGIEYLVAQIQAKRNAPPPSKPLPPLADVERNDFLIFYEHLAREIDQKRRFEKEVLADIQNREHIAGNRTSPLIEDQISQYIRKKGFGESMHAATTKLLFLVLDPPAPIRKLLSEKETRGLYFRVLQILASDFPAAVQKCYFQINYEPEKRRPWLYEQFRLGLADMDIQISLANLQKEKFPTNRLASGDLSISQKEDLILEQLQVFRVRNERNLKNLLQKRRVFPFLLSFFFKTLLILVLLAYLRLKLLPGLPVDVLQNLASSSPNFTPFAPLGIVLAVLFYLIFSIVYNYRLFVLMRERRALFYRSFRKLVSNLGLNLADLATLFQNRFPIQNEKLKLLVMKQIKEEQSILETLRESVS